MSTEQSLWTALKPLIGNPFGIAGLMGNLMAESGLEPCMLEKTYQRKLLLTSEEYTRRVDEDMYPDFATDGAGYGLAQWTYRDHKAALLKLSQDMEESVGSLAVQTEFLLRDIQNFSSVLNVLRRATSVREASDDVLLRYEKPADTSEAVRQKRAAYGQAIFDRCADKEWVEDYMASKAKIVLESAKSRLGDPYVFGAWGEECTPTNRRNRKRADQPEIVDNCPVLSGKQKDCTGCKYQGGHIYDCRGFTYRCLKDAGIVINGQGATSQWKDVSNWTAFGTTDKLPNLVCCLFKQKGSTMSHTGLHIGNGQIIECGGRILPGEVRYGTLDKTWTHFAIPAGLYSAEVIGKAGTVKMVTNLKKGSAGPEVQELQENLIILGYKPGVADGIFGGATLAAVKAFQTDNGLTVDGIAGVATQALIIKKVAEKDNGKKSPQATVLVKRVDLEAIKTLIDSYLRV